jgi:hypothetical protein
MSANIDYVTSHQGQAHITTQNVIDLLAGFSGDVSGIKVFPQLYDHLATQIIDALTIRVKRGAALAGGSFFILDDPYDWALDAGVVGYSRIDILYVVLYKDPDTDIESCDFDYQAGDLYPNGTTGQVPAPPSGTNIVATYPLFRMNMTDGAIQNVISYAENYISNSSLSTEIAQMKVTFQAGVDTIYNAIRNNGVTPSASTPAACATGINNIRSGGNATAAQILKNKTAYSGKSLITGQMENRGAWTGSGTPSGNNSVNIIIPAGFHNGSGYVTCNGGTAYYAGRNQGRADKNNQLPIYITVHMINGVSYVSLMGSDGKWFNGGNPILEGAGNTWVAGKASYNGGFTET